MIMEKKELWHEMLTTYCRLMHYENGITIPNMIGAYYCFDDTIDLASSECIVRVLDDITASQKEMEVLIQRCCNIGNYVLSPLKCKHHQHPKVNPKIYLNMYDTHLRKYRSDLGEIAEYLYSLHRDEIKAKEFSLTDNIWHSLSNIELGYINNIINSLS